MSVHKRHVGYHITPAEKRKVFFLQPYLDDDTDYTLVIDNDSLPTQYRSQLEGVVDTISAQHQTRLVDHLQHESFNDGTNILAYAHHNGHIKKIHANELVISSDGSPNSVLAYKDVLKIILENDGKVSAKEVVVPVTPDTTITQATPVTQNVTLGNNSNNIVTRFEDNEKIVFTLDKTSVESMAELGKAYYDVKSKTMEYIEHVRAQHVDVYNLIKGGDVEITEAIAAILGVETLPLRKMLSKLRNMPMEGEEIDKKARRVKAENVK